MRAGTPTTPAKDNSAERVNTLFTFHWSLFIGVGSEFGDVVLLPCQLLEAFAFFSPGQFSLPDEVVEGCPADAQHLTCLVFADVRCRNSFQDVDDLDAFLLRHVAGVSVDVFDELHENFFDDS